MGVIAKLHISGWPHRLGTDSENEGKQWFPKRVTLNTNGTHGTKQELSPGRTTLWGASF